MSLSSSVKRWQCESWVLACILSDSHAGGSQLPCHEATLWKDPSVKEPLNCQEEWKPSVQQPTGTKAQVTDFGWRSSLICIFRRDHSPLLQLDCNLNKDLKSEVLSRGVPQIPDPQKQWDKPFVVLSHYVLEKVIYYIVIDSTGLQ